VPKNLATKSLNLGSGKGGWVRWWIALNHGPTAKLVDGSEQGGNKCCLRNAAKTNAYVNEIIQSLHHGSLEAQSAYAIISWEWLQSAPTQHTL